MIGVPMKMFRSLLVFFFPIFLLVGEENRVAIGSRTMSKEAAAQVEAQRGKPILEEEELETARFFLNLYPPVFFSNSHHWLVAVTVLDNDQYTLELEDGSVWKINSYDGLKALTWRTNDPLTITQNNRWFSKHAYRIINKSNDTYVEATLFLGPVELGQFSRFIIGIDPTRRELLLSDNTHWEISYLDTSLFKDWALNDYIIIGTNSNTSIWDSGSDVLLINVNMNNTVRAKQF